MPNFQHLFIPGHGALTHTYLLNVGKVNAICGRNNSGKSTLLSAIAADDGPRTGFSTTDEMIEQFALNFTDGIGNFRQNNTYTRMGFEVGSLATRVYQSEARWYGSERDKFFQEFTVAWKNSILGRYTLDRARLNSSFEAFFPELPSRVLIPPNRTLELRGATVNRTEVTPQGIGLLNHLFRCKNQETGTRDRTLYDQILGHFGQISGGYLFDIVTIEQGERISLRFRTPQGKSSEASACGLGLQDLLIILYHAFEHTHAWLLIEEPETHLHPELQRKLLHLFEKETDKTYFFSTHSNVLLDGAYIDKVYFTTYSGSITVRDETNRALLLSDLGYQVSDNLVSDLIVLVEGPKDVPVLQVFLDKIGGFDDSLVKFWPLGGDIMDQLDLSVFSERYKIRALIDRDPASTAVRKRFQKKCEESNIEVHRLERYALENYMSLRAIREVFNEQVPATVSTLEAGVAVDKQIGFSIKRQLRNVARAMTLQEIEGTDLHSFLISLRSK